MNKKVWIDTDCGVDDALALIIACHLDNIDILGMSSGVGTTTAENTFRNTRNVLHLAKRDDIRVYPGATSAWIREYAPAPDFHGENGLGDVIIEDSPNPKENKAAWDAMYETAKENGKITIVTLGQMTNLANAIIKYPDFNEYVEEVAIMGGAIVSGNTTMAAEANIYRDPEAAQCVFKSGLKITLFPIDVTSKVYLTKKDQEEIRNYGSDVCKFIYEATRIPVSTNIRLRNNEDYDLHDPSPVIYLKYPEYFKGKDASVYVETRSPLTAGKTVSDVFTLMDQRLKENHVMVMLEAQRDELVEVVKEILAKA